VIVRNAPAQSVAFVDDFQIRVLGAEHRYVDVLVQRPLPTDEL